jgi:PhnB protein
MFPMIAYEDGPAALDWLARTFGFRERTRIVRDGKLTHGEMETGSGVIMCATPSPDYESPRRHRERCDAARRWSEVPYIIDGLLVYVDGIDEHYHRAAQAGAVILSSLEEGPPGKRYRVEDLEGHRWMFMERPATSDSEKRET